LGSVYRFAYDAAHKKRSGEDTATAACLINRSTGAGDLHGHRFAVLELRMNFEITIENTGERYRCSSERNLLVAMEQLGRRGIPVGCRNGGCGVCKVHIVSGDYTTRVMSRAHISEEDEAGRIVLACRAFPRSDIRLRALDKMAVCIEKSFERSPQGIATAWPAATAFAGSGTTAL